MKSTFRKMNLECLMINLSLILSFHYVAVATITFHRLPPTTQPIPTTNTSGKLRRPPPVAIFWQPPLATSQLQLLSLPTNCAHHLWWLLLAYSDHHETTTVNQLLPPSPTTVASILRPPLLETVVGKLQWPPPSNPDDRPTSTIIILNY